jgi:hypothetical protein
MAGGGALGAFLLFCVPIGGGMSAGVDGARGASPPVMAVLYFLSDVVLAFTFSPSCGRGVGGPLGAGPDSGA